MPTICSYSMKYCKRFEEKAPVWLQIWKYGPQEIASGWDHFLCTVKTWVWISRSHIKAGDTVTASTSSTNTGKGKVKTGQFLDVDRLASLVKAVKKEKWDFGPNKQKVMTITRDYPLTWTWMLWHIIPCLHTPINTSRSGGRSSICLMAMDHRT